MSEAAGIRNRICRDYSGLLIFSAVYAAAFALDRLEAAVVPALLLIGDAVFLYFFYSGGSGSLLDPAALFSLFFTGGEGIALFRLSHLQRQWETETWLCFWLAHVSFAAAYRIMTGISRSKGQQEENNTGGRKQGEKPVGGRKPETDRTWKSRILPGKFFLNADRTAAALVILTAVSLVSFIIEAVIIGYIPLFTTDMPHAYSYFHVSGLHYFTVSCVLVPSLFVLLLFSRGVRSGRMVLCAVCTAAAFMLPLLLVSRFQMIFSAVLAVLTALLLKEDHLKDRLNPKLLIAGGGLLALLLALYVFLTVERAHSVSYLNGIFEMRVDTPIWITQPYIYIANNYDNFNCLVRELPEHTLGLRMLFPVFALTGLKFLKPELVSFPLYITKEELTTVTLFYDAYYDFGAAGIAVCSALLGILMAAMAGLLRRIRNGRIRKFSPVIYLIMAQLDFYLIFSFFTTWFSNPATWFYFGVSLLVYFFTVSDYGCAAGPAAASEKTAAEGVSKRPAGSAEAVQKRKLFRRESCSEETAVSAENKQKK